MSTVRKTFPHIIQRLIVVNTLTISKILSSGGKVLASGNYKITEDIDETKQRIHVTSVNEDYHQNNSVNILDDKGNFILECNQVKRTCLRTVLNIYSSAGFKLGSLRKRLCIFKTEYEICSGNRNLLFLLKIDSKPTGFRIKITNVDEQRVVATFDLLTRQIDKVEFTLTYLENIAILQKSLIFCAAISCCEQEYKVQTFKYNICSILNDKLCCPLFEESKIKFYTVCILFPVLIGFYFSGLLLYVGLSIGLYQLFFLLICAPKFRYFSKLVFTWPCILCGLYKPDI